jgi:hypothetical protein
MNGRIYDPTLGRFMQADPHIQAPENSQNYNRYSYVLNNPMSYTDPSGYFFKSLFKAATFLSRAIIRQISKVPILNGLAQAAACFYGGPWGCAAYATVANFEATGSLGAAFRSGAIAFASAHDFRAIGDKFQGTGFWAENGIGHIGAHAVTGGIISELQGGKFGHGFFSAGFTKFATANAGFDFSDTSTGAVIGRTAIAAVIGGTASKISGGKFANGAGTAAMAHLFNAESWKSQNENTQTLKVTNPVTGEVEELLPNFHPVRDADGNLMLDLNGNVMSVHHSMLTKFVIPYGENAPLLSCQHMQACTDGNFLSDSPMTNLSKPRISTNSILSNPNGVRIVGNGWFMTQPGPTVVITGATEMGQVMWCSNSSAVQAACGGN